MTSVPNNSSDTPTESNQTSRWAWPLILVVTFLNAIGMTIVFPVLPFVTMQFLPDESSLALWVGILEAVFALCAFVVAPLFGGISDRFGRRPVLIYSLVGGAIGYLLFGLAGSIWMLVLSRVIQGLASGDMPALFAYVADITPKESRTKRFGFLGAVAGVATMVGPGIGGLLAKVSLTAPVFTTAGITLVVALLCLFVLPESLKPENRSSKLVLTELNPVVAIRSAFSRPTLRPLILGVLLVSIPFTFFVTNFSVVAFDSVNWGPTEVGLLMTVNGLLDIAIQGALLAVLVPRIGERGVIMAGVIGQAVGCLGLALTAGLLHLPWLFAGAAILFAAGEGGMTAALNGLMSTRVEADEQGWLAGSLSSVNSAIQVVVPLLGGWIYSAVSHSAPYWLSLVLILIAAVVLMKATATPQKPASTIQNNHERRAEAERLVS